MLALPKMHDPIPNVLELEARAKRDRTARIRSLEGQVNLAHRVMAMRSSPGWADYEKAVTALRDEVMVQIRDQDGPDSKLRILQGRLQALDSVLGAMKISHLNLQALEGQLKHLKDQEQFNHPLQGASHEV